MASRKFWSGRVLIGTVAAMALIGAMTLPGLAAPSKTMTFQVNTTGPTTDDFSAAVNTAPASSSATFWIRVTNTTPGTGNPNSLRVTAPTTPSGFVITDAAIDSANSSRPNPNATTSISGASVDINALAPLRNGEFITVMVVATTPPGSCPGPVTSTAWTGKLWSGTPVGSGQPFNTTVSTGTQTSLTSNDCATLEFVTAPHDAATDTKITGTDFDPDGPTVQVAIDPSSAFAGETVTITEDGAGSITGNTAPLSGGLADFPLLKIDTAGEYNLTATVNGGPSTAPVAITITQAGVCPGSGVSGQTDFTTPEFNEPGEGTLNIEDLTSTDCTGLDIIFTRPEDVQQWTIGLTKPDATAKVTGYTTWTWDLTGTGPVPWTEVSWRHNDDGQLVFTDFVPLPRCNAEAVHFPPQSAMPDPSADNPDYQALFPLVDTTNLGTITAGLCLYDSALQVLDASDTYIEVQRIAINEDPSGRK